MELKDILNEFETAQLEKLLDNPVLCEAIRKVFLFGIYYNGTIQKGLPADPTRNFTLALAFQKDVSNEHLGADLRACTEAIRMVEMGFKELSRFKKEEEVKKEEPNPAR